MPDWREPEILRPAEIIGTSITMGDATRDFFAHDAPIVKGMMEDVFGGKSYPFFKGEWIEPIDPRLIVDVGADIGAFSVYMWFNCPQAVIHAFEPSGRALPLLRRNVEDLPVHIHPYGLDDQNRTETLYHSSIGYVGDSINPCEYNDVVGSERIELRDFAGEMARLGIEEIDVLKVDAEGCEVPILESMVAAGIQPKWLYVEFHCEEDRRTIDALLAPTHKWYVSSFNTHHRGDMVWLRNDQIKPIVDRLKIEPRRKEALA